MRAPPVQLTLPAGSGTLARMPSAYFDTTVYDDIAKGVVPVAELDAIGPLIAGRQIIAYPSLTDIDELLGQWDTAPPKE